MNVTYCLCRQFYIVAWEFDYIHNLGRNYLIRLSHFDNSFMYWKISIVRDTVSPERLIYCWSLRIMLWKYSICSPLLNDRVDRSDWISPFIPPIWGVRTCILLDRIFHQDISWKWVLTTLKAWCAMEYFTQDSFDRSIKREWPR